MRNKKAKRKEFEKVLTNDSFCGNAQYQIADVYLFQSSHLLFQLLQFSHTHTKRRR